jgi:sulfite reductase (NADPH) hemoprotein beta-component
MYRYDDYDAQLVAERVDEFRDQVARRMSGELSEEEFLPLRLQNGLYMQKHAYMLRVAIPYGVLSSQQLRMLAHIARHYDRGYGHFTTRQNIQYNWIALEQAPDILAELASVEMHAIQTSGNCVRNITTEQFAGVAPDEVLDPRPLAELLRQWSTLNPEFAFLPRKFKIALSASTEDRAAVRMHDVGLYLYQTPEGKKLRVFAGGGLGRTPILSSMIRDDLPWEHMLSYVEAVLRVYNRYGRRDNKYKARIKILVKALGADVFAAEVEEEWAHLRGGHSTLTEQEYERVARFFVPGEYEHGNSSVSDLERYADNKRFMQWCKRNVRAHKVSAYASVTLSTKPGAAVPPGDVTADQMEKIASWAEDFGFGEIRIAHEQNVILPDVKKSDLYDLWLLAEEAGLATPNRGLLTDMIACPGGDYCSLANARSLPIASAIAEHFENLDFLNDLGDLSLNISGCINACGHHHMGNIGILGVDKDGQEWYQVTIGGAQGTESSLGKVIGPSFRAEQMPEVIERLVDTYVAQRIEDEPFIDTLNRIGIEPFKAGVYGQQVAA